MSALCYNVVQVVATQCQESGNWDPLAECLATAFGDINILCSSFIDASSAVQGQEARANKVDKYDTLMTFEILQQCPRSVLEVVTESARRLLQHCIAHTSEISFDDIYLNVLVILFQMPTVDNENSYGYIKELLELVSCLEKPTQDRLCEYLIEPIQIKESMFVDMGDSSTEFRLLLDRIHQVIRSQVKKRLPIEGSATNIDSHVIFGTKMLSILYRLNERRHYVDFSRFYNDAVNENLMFVNDDFLNLTHQKGFSFWNYPFILNLSIKAEILTLERTVRMRKELHSAFFRALFQGVNSPYLILEIRRDHIIMDTLQQLEQKSLHDLKKQLRVQFVGEEAVDEGGVQKEFFQLLIRELFDINYGMFRINEESRLCWFVPNPMVDDLTLREYKLVGILLGLAVYNGIILDLHFPLALYKKLMNVNVDLSDLKQLDPSLAKGLEYLLNNNDIALETEYDRTFQADIETFDQVITFDLKPMGSLIPLTHENKHDFVRLYTNFILDTSVDKQFFAFREGFDLVCGDSTIKRLRSEEIEQLICGCSDLDFVALENATSYDGGLTRESPMIKNFWEIVHDFTDDEKHKLLFFATGSDRAPIGGLGKLQFVISKNGDSDRLPTSHTCYNVLMLGEYNSKEQLRERLLMSISNAEGFGLI